MKKKRAGAILSRTEREHAWSIFVVCNHHGCLGICPAFGSCTVHGVTGRRWAGCKEQIRKSMNQIEPGNTR